MSELRSRLYQLLHAASWSGPGISPLNQAILLLVLFSVLVAIVQSEPAIHRDFPAGFALLNLILAVTFTVEYAVRTWAMAEDPNYAGLKGAFRFARTLPSALDLIATAAIWVDVITGIPGIYCVLLRLIRAVRVVTLTRNSRWSQGARLLFRTLARRNCELTLAFGLTGIMLLVASTLLFAVEGEVQPEAFGSIPRSMWWAMATLTTVGYGDVYPITALGKILATATAFCAIGVVAMPAGILAAAFSDAFQALRGAKEE